MQFGHDGIFQIIFLRSACFFYIHNTESGKRTIAAKREAGALFTLEHIEKKLCGFRTGKALFCRGFGKNTYGSKHIHALLRYLRFFIGKNT